MYQLVTSCRRKCDAVPRGPDERAVRQAFNIRESYPCSRMSRKCQCRVGRFRVDLAVELGVMLILLPPLRVPLLSSRHFMRALTSWICFYGIPQKITMPTYQAKPEHLSAKICQNLREPLLEESKSASLKLGPPREQEADAVFDDQGTG